MLTQQRLLLVQIIELIAILENDRPAVSQAVHRAAQRLGEGRDREALESLRSAPSEAVVSAAWLIELYLLEEP